MELIPAFILLAADVTVMVLNIMTGHYINAALMLLIILAFLKSLID